MEPTVLRLLVHLITNRDRLVTHDELMDTVWGDTVISESALSKAVARLRKALGDRATRPKYVETVYSLGYRFVAEVEEIGVSGTAEHEAKESPMRTSGRRYFMGGLLGLLTLTALLLVFWPSSRQSSQPLLDDFESLAVLPLANLTGDPDQEFLVDGLHDVLISELSRISGLRVTSRQSTLRYKGSDLTIPTIAEELGVDVIVEGSALPAGEQFELSLQVINGHTDEHLWTNRYRQDTSQVFDFLSSVAFAISSELLSGRGDEVSAPPQPHHRGAIDPEASIAYLRGQGNLSRWTKDALENAISQFKRATDIEPGFAEAWGALSFAQAMTATLGYAPPGLALEESRSSALKAVESYDQHYRGHAILGWLQLWFNRDYTAACNAFENALRLNPSDPMSLHGKADCLMLVGRMDESVDLAHRTQLVNPFKPMASRPFPYHLYIARRYDEALSATLDLQDRIPSHPVYDLLTLIYWQQGDWGKALNELKLKLEWQKDDVLLEALEAGMATTGPHGAMHAVAETMVKYSESRSTNPFRIGEAFALAGDADKAIYWLGKAVEQGAVEAVYISVRPDFDLLRDHPRYPEMIERLGLGIESSGK